MCSAFSVCLFVCFCSEGVTLILMVKTLCVCSEGVMLILIVKTLFAFVLGMGDCNFYGRNDHSFDSLWEPDSSCMIHREKERTPSHSD